MGDLLGRARAAVTSAADGSAAFIAHATRASIGYLAPYALASIGVGTAVWAYQRPQELNELFANKVKFEEQLSILKTSLFALAALVLATIIAFVVYRLVEKRFALTRVTSRASAWMMVLAAAPCVTACFVPGIEASHPLLTLLFAALGSTALGVAIYRGTADVLFRAGSERDEAPPSKVKERSAQIGVAVVLALLWATYAYIFSRFAITTHHALESRTIDLGIYDNIFYQSAHGRPLGCTLIKGEYHGSAHFDPILVILSPIYRLYPHAETLLVIQSVWIGSAVIPAYLIARNATLGRVASVALATTFLLHPALHGANLYEFHSLSLAFVPILWAFYTLEAGKLRAYFAVLALCLLVREDIALFMCFFAVSAMLRHGGPRMRAGLATLLIALAYFVIVKWKFMMSADVFNGSDNGETYGFAYYFEGLSRDKGFGGFILSIFTNPIYLVSLVFEETKLTFLLTMVLPFALLPFISRGGRIILLYGFLFIMLASRTAVFSTHFQYTAPFLPVFYALTPSAIVRLRSSARVASLGISPERLARALVVTIFTASCFVSIKFGAILENQSFRGGFSRVAKQLTPDEIKTYAWVTEMVKLIPKTAPVGTTNKLGPHVSNRPGIYWADQAKGRAAYYFVDESEIGNQDFRNKLKQDRESGKLVELGRRGSMVLLKVEAR